MRPPRSTVLATCLLVLTSCVAARAARAQDDGGVTLLAYNVLFEGADDAKTLAAIGDAAPDVVCLTEVTPRFVQAFEKALGAKYPHRAFQPAKGTWGVGLASKRPLRAVEVVRQSPSRMPALEARVTLDGVDGTVTCVHWMPPGVKHHAGDSFADALKENAGLRGRQAAAFVARYAKARGPVVLLGDFNEEPGGAGLAALEDAGWSRACAVAGRCGATFPGPASPWPAVFTIDHVYVRGLAVTDARTVRAGGSDHFPVLARVRRGP